jgi:hypothetical protein
MMRYNQPVTRRALTDLEPSPVPRRRAPRRVGHRTQLTVPDELWTAAEEMGHDIGTTPNDVVVRLATIGLKWAQRQAEHDAIAEARWSAYRAARRREPVADEFPSEAEVLAAVLGEEE